MSTNSQIRIPKIIPKPRDYMCFVIAVVQSQKLFYPKNLDAHIRLIKIVFKALIYVPGSKDVRSRVLKARNYKDAIIEKIQFEKQLKANNYINSPLAKPRNHSLLLMPSNCRIFTILEQY
jgi:hypothetical protein